MVQRCFYYVHCNSRMFLTSGLNVSCKQNTCWTQDFIDCSQLPEHSQHGWRQTVNCVNERRTWLGLNRCVTMVTTCVCLCSSYLRVVTVVMEIVGVGSVGAPVTRLLEHFLGFGRHPWLALSHATLGRSGTHTYTQVRGLQIREVFNWRNSQLTGSYIIFLTNQEVDLLKGS